MSKDKLRELLAKLHTELKSTPEVDAGSRTMLRGLMDDIHEVLDKPEDAGPERHSELLHDFTETTQVFEAKHPEIASTMRTVMNALANMGI